MLHWRVFDGATVVRPIAAKKRPLSLVFTMTRGGGNSEFERFHIQVSVESTRRFLDYYVELEFPSAFLQSQFSDVKDRRTATHQVLTATPREYTKVLNPGNNNLMGFEFFVKRDDSQRDLMTQMVRATTYYEDTPIAIEHSIEELCNKENPLVFREG